MHKAEEFLKSIEQEEKRGFADECQTLVRAVVDLASPASWLLTMDD